MMEERIAHAEMQRLCPTLTAKTELVLVRNPVTGDEAVYERDGGEWVHLDYEGATGSAAPETPSPGAAPLSWRKPDDGPDQRDDGPAEATGPAGSLPQGEAE